MLKLYRVTKVKVLFLVIVYVFNFNLFKFSAVILEKGLFPRVFSLLFLSDYESELVSYVNLLVVVVVVAVFDF